MSVLTRNVESTNTFGTISYDDMQYVVEMEIKCKSGVHKTKRVKKKFKDREGARQAYQSLVGNVERYGDMLNIRII